MKIFLILSLLSLSAIAEVTTLRCFTDYNSKISEKLSDSNWFSSQPVSDQYICSTEQQGMLVEIDGILLAKEHLQNTGLFRETFVHTEFVDSEVEYSFDKSNLSQIEMLSIIEILDHTSISLNFAHGYENPVIHYFEFFFDSNSQERVWDTINRINHEFKIEIETGKQYQEMTSIDYEKFMLASLEKNECFQRPEFERSYNLTRLGDQLYQSNYPTISESSSALSVEKASFQELETDLNGAQGFIGLNPISKIIKNGKAFAYLVRDRNEVKCFLVE